MRLFTLPLCEIDGDCKVPQRRSKTPDQEIEKSNTLPTLRTGFTMIKDKITKLAAIQGLPPIDSFSRKKMSEHAEIDSGSALLSPLLLLNGIQRLRTCRLAPSTVEHRASGASNQDNLSKMHGFQTPRRIDLETIFLSLHKTEHFR